MGFTSQPCSFFCLKPTRLVYHRFLHENGSWGTRKLFDFCQTIFWCIALSLQRINHETMRFLQSMLRDTLFVSEAGYLFARLHQWKPLIKGDIVILNTKTLTSGPRDPWDTLPETKKSPESKPSQEESSLPTTNFEGLC